MYFKLFCRRGKSDGVGVISRLFFFGVSNIVLFLLQTDRIVFFIIAGSKYDSAGLPNFKDIKTALTGLAELGNVYYSDAVAFILHNCKSDEFEVIDTLFEELLPM